MPFGDPKLLTDDRFRNGFSAEPDKRGAEADDWGVGPKDFCVFCAFCEKMIFVFLTESTEDYASRNSEFGKIW